jgi:hypothetical protein
LTPEFLYDDAYITLASAQALWLGHDPHFPGTTPLHGVTSPAHCLIVAALLAVLPPAWALLVSCLAGSLVYGWGLWALGRFAGLRQVEAAGLVLAGLGAGMTSQHLVNGLETSWALATVTWLLVFSLRGEVGRLGALAGSAPFVRPELALLSAALLAWHTWTSPQKWRVMGTSAVCAALPFVLVIWIQTGSVVPSSLGAKQAWYAEGCWTAGRRARVVAAGLTGWLETMPLVAFGALGLARTGPGRVALAASAVVLTVWALSVPNVLHAYQRHRYFAVFLPLLVCGLVHLPRWIRPVLIGGAALMAAIATISVVRFEPTAIAQAMAVRRGVNATLAANGAARVMLHDAGYLAYSGAIREGVDMVGLKSPRAMALHEALTRPSCGEHRGEALARLAVETRPTHLVIWQPWDDFFHVTRALAAAGWRANRLATLGAVEQVQVYALTPPAN